MTRFKELVGELVSVGDGKDRAEHLRKGAWFPPDKADHGLWRAAWCGSNQPAHTSRFSGAGVLLAFREPGLHQEYQHDADRRHQSTVRRIPHGDPSFTPSRALRIFAAFAVDALSSAHRRECDHPAGTAARSCAFSAADDDRSLTAIIAAMSAITVLP